MFELLFQVGIARFQVSFCSCKCHFKSRWIKLPSKAQGSVHGNPAISPSTQLGNFTSIQTGTTTSGQGCEPWSQFTKSLGLLRSFKRAKINWTVKIYTRLCRHKATKLDVSTYLDLGYFGIMFPFSGKNLVFSQKKNAFFRSPTILTDQLLKMETHPTQPTEPLTAA